MDIRDKVVYQIYPKSFYDTNGDGLGDLAGVTAKLDYLKELGVDFLWLTPFFVSPQNDNGYDVADYCAVDPRFGTMEDAEALIHAARERGSTWYSTIHRRSTRGSNVRLPAIPPIWTTIFGRMAGWGGRRRTGCRSSAKVRGSMCLPAGNTTSISSM